jgi:hypothetical protein
MVGCNERYSRHGEDKSPKFNVHHNPMKLFGPLFGSTEVCVDEVGALEVGLLDVGIQETSVPDPAAFGSKVGALKVGALEV